MSLANMKRRPKGLVLKANKRLTPGTPVAIERAGHCGLEEAPVGWLAATLGLLWLLHG